MEEGLKKQKLRWSSRKRKLCILRKSLDQAK